MRFHTRSRTPQLFPSANASKKTKRARGRACEREREREEKNGKITNCTVVSVSIDERARAVHSLTLARKASPQKRGEVSHDYKKKKKNARARKGGWSEKTHTGAARTGYLNSSSYYGARTRCCSRLSVWLNFFVSLYFSYARAWLSCFKCDLRRAAYVYPVAATKKKKIPSAG